MTRNHDQAPHFGLPLSGPVVGVSTTVSSAILSLLSGSFVVAPRFRREHQQTEYCGVPLDESIPIGGVADASGLAAIAKSLLAMSSHAWWIALWFEAYAFSL